MKRKTVTHFVILIALIAVSLSFSACQSKKTAGQLMMDVTGESFPIKKAGWFGKDHIFWVFEIKHVERSGKNVRGAISK